MKLMRLSHVMFAVRDIEATDRFTADFGLHTVVKTPRRLVKRTSGSDPYCYIAEAASVAEFRGFALVAEGIEDLREAVSVHGASAIQPMASGPGYMTTLRDPDGIRVDLVTGMASAEPHAPDPDLIHNSPLDMRRYNRGQAPRDLAPAHLFRLGHVGLTVSHFTTSLRWYQRTLGLIPSDLMHAGNPDIPICSFLRLDRGDEYTDHHTVALFQGAKGGYHHSSFEVQDYHAQFMAHRWLQSRGWDLNWGVGRHPLGSHVFDMWFAPDRFRFETFSDTDALNAEGPRRVHDVRETGGMDLWSSDPPDRYFA